LDRGTGTQQKGQQVYGRCGMTKEEAAIIIHKLKQDVLTGAVRRYEPLEGEVLLSAEFYDAINMAIASLEAWEKVKREIREYFKEGVMDGDVITTHLCEIIDKHLSEVQNNE
jgi:hypothetical protein